MSPFRLNFLLNAHLPFVRHPEYPVFFEETWLFEAMDETYLPLLRVFHQLEEEGVDFRLTMSFSPTLTAMLTDRVLQERYRGHVEMHIELGEKEVARTQGTPEEPLAAMYLDLYRRNLEDFSEVYQGNILKGYQYFQKQGKLEIATTLATHAFAPLYQDYASNVRAQVQAAVDSHYHIFNVEPTGIWLPEAAYYPGLDSLLARSRLQYFYLSAHGALLSDQRPERGVFAPVKTPAGIAAFPRHLSSSNDVWKKENGYPADPAYRDFYRDIGYDLPMEYVGPYLPSGDNRSSTGFKYFRVTGPTDQKEHYDPAAASQKVREHAQNYIYNRQKTADRLTKAGYDWNPVFTIPFDAELFGHWWFEGPQWIGEVLRQAAAQPHIQLVTPPMVLESEAPKQTIAPPFSSWGTKGYAEVWLDGSNDWVYRHIHRCIQRLQDLARRFPNESGRKERALNQAAREVLLAQASDWPMMIKLGTTGDYARRRVVGHIANFNRIYETISSNHIDTEWLTSLEKRDNIFPHLDYRQFA